MFPPTGSSEIDSVLQSSYSPSQVSALEAIVDDIATGAAPYSFSVVRTLLKLYQLFPALSNASKVSQCFFLAMVQYPATDLLALSYLVPQAPASIMACGDLLDACQFPDFWKAYASLLSQASAEKDDTMDTATSSSSSSSLLLSSALIRSAKPTLQRSIVTVLAVTYQSVPAAILLPCCDATSCADPVLASHPSIQSIMTSEEGDHTTVVVFYPTSDNTKRQRVFQEGISYPAIATQLCGQ